jgi:hypothetical protein
MLTGVRRFFRLWTRSETAECFSSPKGHVYFAAGNASSISDRWTGSMPEVVRDGKLVAEGGRL